MRTARSLVSMLCLLAGGAAACDDGSPSGRRGGAAEGVESISAALDDGRAAVDGYFAAPTSFILAPGNVAPSTWRYTFNTPAANWNTSGFNDSTWSTGQAGFGWNTMPPDVVNTSWTTSDIWLRRTVTLTSTQIPSVVFWARWDDDIEIYLNGRLAASTVPDIGNPHSGWTPWYRYLGILDNARAGLVTGTNTIAIHVKETGGGAYVDVGLATNPMQTVPTTGSEATTALAPLTNAVKAYMTENVIPGGVFAVIKDDKIVVTRGLGYANKARTVTVPQDAIMRLASVDKALSFTAARQLIAQGFVDPVTNQPLTANTPVFPLLAAHGLTLLPGKSLPAGMNNVTIQHIIDHASGIGYDPDSATLYSETGTTENTFRISDFVRYLYSNPLIFQPGTSSEYSSNAVMVLRYLVRVLKGDYQPYMQKQFLGPAGSHEVFVARERLADRSPREIWYATLSEPWDRWIGLDEYYALSTSSEGLARYIRRYDMYNLPGVTFVNPTTGLWTPANEPAWYRDWGGVMGGSWAFARYQVTEQLGIVVMFNIGGYFDPLIQRITDLAATLPASAWGIAGPPVARQPVPNDAARNVSANPTLTWTAGSGATSHDVRFGTSFPLPLRGNQVGTSFVPGALQPNTTYYWRIDEKNGTGTREGTMWSFTTAGTLPAVATNPSPTNGSTGVSLTPTLSWSAGAGATSHDVYFGALTEPPFAANRTTTNFTPATLLPNTWYTWRVEQRNASGAVTGVNWRFQTGGGTGNLFSDNFQSGAGAWTPLSGTWGIATDGTQVYRQTNNTNNARSSAGQATWTNQRLTVRVKPLSWNGTDRFVAVFARFRDANNYYYVTLRSSNKLELKKFVNGTTTTLATKTFTVALNTWYTVKLEAIGNSLSVSVNGTPQLSGTDSTFPTGKIGLGTFNATASFDDVVVTP
jgi:CubicO group peptidase (beta-lactamase class C family)